MTDYNNTLSTYEEIEKAVMNYQSGTPGAADSIVNAFQHFMFKYVNLLKGGPCPLDDMDLQRFVFLYMKNEWARKGLYSKRPARAREDMAKTLSFVQKLVSPIESGDLYQDMVVILLTMARRYEPKGGCHFVGYAKQAFPYYVFRSLQAITKDPSWRDRCDTEPSVEDFSLTIGDKPEPFFTVDEYMDGVDENWVLGLTANEPFETLSILERKIVKLFYEDGLTDAEVADHLAMSRSTIWRKRLLAKGKIQDAQRRQKGERE